MRYEIKTTGRMANRKGTFRGVLQCRMQTLIMFIYYTALCGIKTEAAELEVSKTVLCMEDCISEHEVQWNALNKPNDTESLPSTSIQDNWMIQCFLKCLTKNILETGNRSKRYAVKDENWPTKNLTYNISLYPTSLNKIIVDKEICKAFALWSEYTDLTFTPKIGTVDIEVKFVRRDHGDGEPFAERLPGGKNNYKVVHIFIPEGENRVEVHFDDQVEWSTNNDHRKSLLLAATHAFGHALGLDHSTNKLSVMYPRNYGTIDVKLHHDDIAAIQGRYGAKTPEQEPDICKDPTIDTVFTSAKGDIYVFKGKYYWELTNDENATAEYPKLIATKWEGLPSDIDAAFTDEKGTTYFFKGSQYWTYQGEKMDQGFPRYINESFHGIPDDIDAATSMYGSKRIWFSKGTEYWIFDPDQTPHVDSRYPEPNSNLQGVPNNVNGVLNQQDYISFFEGIRFYRHDKKATQWNLRKPVYTRPGLFGCPSNTYSLLERLANIIFGDLSSDANFVKNITTLSRKKLDF